MTDIYKIKKFTRLSKITLENSINTLQIGNSKYTRTLVLSQLNMANQYLITLLNLLEEKDNERN